jgi:hypothetical protein
LPWDAAISLDLQSRIQRIEARWTGSYTLHETYRALEAYLGFEDFVSIVPRNVQPSMGGFMMEEAATDLNNDDFDPPR